MDGKAYEGTLDLIQDDNNRLTGSFEFSDGSGSTQLLSTSFVDDNSVIIEWMLSTYKLNFQGAVSSDCKSMSGSYSTESLAMGNWSATKSSQKSAIIIKESINSEKEQFLEILHE
ncbi:MAG: hypothetical protein PF517_12985 [Salinivirgaceae bacterium]|jgi:hypothetical protein|nr:hypothetical protein [Salinivirgaceae bacterium]